MKLALNTSGIIKRLRNNISLLLWFSLFILLLLSAWKIKGQIDTVLSAKKVDQGFPARSSRINFGLYDDIQKMFDSNNTYSPAAVTETSPFGTLEIKEQTPPTQ